MLKFGNREFRNLQEQVLKNMQNIANLKEGTAVLSEFGIKVVGEVDSLQDLPSVIDYKSAHEDWEYGDAFAIGTQPPYTLVILTRANDEITADHWFDIGDFPAPGPQGATGPQGEVGPQGQTGDQGPAGVDAGFGSVLATAQTLPAGSPATVTVTASGPNTAKEFSFVFGLPRGADGGNPVWGNIQGTLSDQTDLQDALDDKQDTLVSGTNIKTINNQSVVGSGNIEINSGVWGNITGTLSDQTDLQTALNAKANTSSLATVATTGAYADLSGKPTIGTGTITIKKNGDTIDSFGLNQTADQNINITVPTKTSDLSNDSNFTSKTYVDDGLALKQDVISDLSNIRAGAEAGATAVQPAAIADMATETWVGQQGYAVAADLATVATSGSYTDLSDKPTIPVVNNATLTIKRNNSTVGTFTANASSDVAINIAVPTGDCADLDEDELDISYTQVSGLSTVAHSGSYVDLSNKPTIGDATISLQLNGNALDSFTANTTSNKTINIPNVMTTNTNQSTENINKIFYDGDEGSVKIMAQRSGTGGTGKAAYLEVSGDGGDWTTTISNGGLAIKDHSAHYLKIGREHKIYIGSTESGTLNTITIPNATGTLALTSQIPTNTVTTNTTQTITGYKTFNTNLTVGQGYGISGGSYVSGGYVTGGYLKANTLLSHTGWFDDETIGGDDTDYDLKIYGNGFQIIDDEDVDDDAPYYIGLPKDDGIIALTKNIPTNNNQLTNGAGYQTASDVSTAIAGQTKETWTFTLIDGTTVTKTVVLG